AYSPDGKLVVSGSWDRTARVWDARTGRELACLRGHRDRLMDLAFSPDSKMVASASQDKTVKLWDLASRRAVATLSGHKNWVGAVALSGRHAPGLRQSPGQDGEALGRALAARGGHPQRI